MSSVEVAQYMEFDSGKMKNSSLPVATDVDFDDDGFSSGHSEGEMERINEKKINSDSEPNQGKDSGIDCGSDSFVPPDEATSMKILQMVEYYFSDANILKDPFLLKHVRRNKEGYVSVKLISSFRKVRNLCRDWKAVSYSIQKSDKLVLNGDGTKVRRLTPLPDFDETAPSRTVIIYGSCNEKVTVESVSEMLSSYGEIAFIRILRPGSSVPVDIKKYVSKIAEIQTKECGLVEFEKYADAKKALKMDCEKENGLRILPLMIKEKERKEPPSPAKSQPKNTTPEQSPKKKKKSRKTTSNAKPNAKIVQKPSEVETETSFNVKQRNNRSSSYSATNHLSSSFGSDSWFNRRHSFNPSISNPYANSPSSFASLSNRSHLYANKGSKDKLNLESTNNSCSLSPWRRRREQSLISELAMYKPSSTLIRSIPVQTIRQPRGPDSTKGFLARTKTVLPSAAANC